MASYLKGKGPRCPICQQERIRDRAATKCRRCSDHPGWHLPRPVTVPPVVPLPPRLALPDELLKLLKAGPCQLVGLATKTGASQGQVLDALLALQERGINLHGLGDRWSLERVPPSPEQAGRTVSYRSRPDGSYRFGVVADTHLGSKYERLDVLNSLYDWFAAEGADRVFHGGNWIEGESRFNRFDISVYGLEQQIVYLADHYPQRPGLVTYAIHGDDHEGWYGQREGVDVGRYAARVMRERGREDWIDLGFLEAQVELVHAETGAKSRLMVMHPGGGSAYALSYKGQKIVEMLSGGEKPAVLLIGHYHKLMAFAERNVWVLYMGSCQDQTPFLRKRQIASVLGGMLVTLRQDPTTGAIIRCLPEMSHAFDRGYYNDRWSKARPPVERKAA